MTETDVKKYLLSAKPFQYLEQDELDMLLAYMKVHTFMPNEILLRQGQKGEGMYFVIQGQALVTAQVMGKGIVNLATMQPGDFVGEVTLIEKGLCTATVTAKETTQALFLPRTYFDMLPNFLPQIRFKIIKGITEVVAQRLEQTNLKIKNIMAESDISPRLAFVSFIKSFSKFKTTTFEKEKISLQFLKKTSFFKSFSDVEFEEVMKNIEVIKAPKRTVIIKEKENKPSFYIILLGAIQTNINQDKKIAKLGVLGPLNLFANTVYIDEKPSILSQVACEDVVLLKIDSKEMDRFKRENIQLWYKIYDKVCNHIVNLEKFAYKFFIRLNSEFYNRS